MLIADNGLINANPAQIPQPEKIAKQNGKTYQTIPVFLKNICDTISCIFNKIINALRDLFGIKRKIEAPVVVVPPPIQPKQDLKTALRIIDGQEAPAPIAKPLTNTLKDLEQHPKNHGMIFSGEAAIRLRDLPVGSALLRFSPDLKQFFISRKENKKNGIQLESYPLGKKSLEQLMQELGIKELVPRPTAAPVQYNPLPNTVAPTLVHIPMGQTEESQLKNLAANKENLSKEDKLKVLQLLKQHLAKNKNDQGIMVTLKAAEHLIINDKTWATFIEKMSKGQVTKQQIQKEITSKLNFIAHPDSNDLTMVLKEFPNAFIRGYLFAHEKGLVADFFKNALHGSDVCFEARTKSIQSWLELNTVEDTALALNFDAKKDNHYQVLSKALDPFKETQLRAYFNLEYKDKVKHLPQLGVNQKSFFFSDSWTMLKNTLEGQEKFYTGYYSKQKFVEFFKTQVILPFKLEKGIENITEITVDNIDKLVEGWIDVSGVDPFDYEDKKAQIIQAQKAAKKPLINPIPGHLIKV